MRFSYLRSVWLAAVVVAVALVGVAAGVSGAATSNSYLVHNLVSDQAGVADHMDANLVNAWGLAALPGSPWWVADNGMNVSTLYTADGTAQSLVVSVPNAPTGVVANTTSGFALSTGGKFGPALFIFDTEEGAILGWNLTGVVTQAVVAVPSAGGAVFKGLAIASTGSGERLYATDFHNGRVDVFDGSFAHAAADFDYGLRARKGGFPIVVAPIAVGTCTRGGPDGTWHDRSLPVGRRWRLVFSRKGLPPRSHARYLRRHGGRAWPLWWISPYVKFALSSLRDVGPKPRAS